MQRLFKMPRKWLMLIYGGVGILFVLVVANLIFNRIIQHNVSEKLRHLSPELKVSFSSVKSNLFTSSLALNSLTIDYIPDSNELGHQHVLRFSKVELSGVNFLMMLFRRTLSVNNLKLSNGKLNLDQFLMNKTDTARKSLFANMPFNSISVRHFELTNIRVWEHTVHANKLLLRGDIGVDEISINDVKKAFTTENFHFGAIKSSLSEINYAIPNAFHTVMIKRITVDSPRGIAQIDAIKLIPQYNKSEFFRRTDNQPLYVAANITDVTILGLDIRQLFEKKLVAEKIIFNHPDFDIYSEEIGSKKALSRSFLFIDLKKDISSIQTDLFRINHANITYQGTTGDELKLHGDIELGKLKARMTDSLFNNSETHFKTLTCALTDIQSVNSGTYQNIQIKKLDVDQKGMLQAASVKIGPQYDKFEVGRKVGHQVDVVDAVISGITITKLDIIRCLQQKVIAEQIWIKESNICIFRDRRLPRVLQYKPLPVSFLKSIPIHFRVHHLKMSASTLLYEEFPKDGLQTGKLKVEKFQLSLSPLISHPNPSDPDHMDLHVEGAIMGSGVIRTSVYLPFKPDKDYYISGAIDNLDLTSLNSSAENLGNFHIESGLLNNLSFQFSLNDEKATGKVVGEYHNLVLDKLKGQSKKIAKFPSFMLKHVIIPKNKDKSLPVDRRTGVIDYRFDHTRSVSFYLLKSLLSGIEASFTFGFLLPK
ncbi:DUF748 domain-containing protein [Chitinophaga sp. G-6-1-13]|uniref:DUF748 domain-containing protein n=1 Tax=Chitinophaga fulva TaxID=2728842 RepID=A0A848GK11_9BACT|nr:DUF748 domain-containing protein [Chitinophaga fulva]NML37739.1 DUF748 domain-containing protein [Chitinophaga fulva]